MSHGVISTSIPARWANRLRRELTEHGCSISEEPGDRFRVDWPPGTLLDGPSGEYTLPSGWSVRLEGDRAK